MVPPLIDLRCLVERRPTDPPSGRVTSSTLLLSVRPEQAEHQIDARHQPARESVARRLWTSCTAMAPSPTAVAQRFVDPDRASPAAKTPGTLVSRRYSASAAAPVTKNPLSSRSTAPSIHSVHGSAPRKRKRNENGS